MSRSLMKPLPPAGESIAPWVDRLRLAMFDAIKEDDVADIVKNLVAKAKDGDPGAIKMVFDYVLGGRQSHQLMPGAAADARSRSWPSDASTARRCIIRTTNEPVSG